MMSEASPALPISQDDLKRKALWNTGTRLARYTAVRLVTMVITIILGMYLTVLIANMGGYVDDIRRGSIREQVQQAVLLDRTLRELSAEERAIRLEEMIRLAEKRVG